MDTNQETAPQAQQQEQPVSSGLISFPDPPSPADQAAAVSDTKPPVDHATAEEQRLAKLEQQKKDFTERVLASRQPEEKPPVKQPVAPLIEERTRAEMEAGRKMNAHHEGLKALRPAAKPPAPNEARTEPVFRPENYTFERGTAQGKQLSTGNAPVR